MTLSREFVKRTDVERKGSRRPEGSDAEVSICGREVLAPQSSSRAAACGDFKIAHSSAEQRLTCWMPESSFQSICNRQNEYVIVGRRLRNLSLAAEHDHVVEVGTIERI